MVGVMLVLYSVRNVRRVCLRSMSKLIKNAGVRGEGLRCRLYLRENMDDRVDLKVFN